MELHILVAEDDPNTRAALAEILESDGHKVTVAADGMQARDLFDKSTPHLACLDVMMPGLSGYDLCRYFRAKTPDLPILFITAKAEEIDKVVGLELGADDYIAKPFGSKEVLARIRAVARRCYRDRAEQTISPKISDQNFSMHGIEIIPKQLRATLHDGTTIELSLRELKILQLLANKPGEVIKRDELFKFAWEESHFPNSRTLDQTISQLRKRIEVDPKNPEIVKTVYGIGYRFDP